MQNLTSVPRDYQSGVTLRLQNWRLGRFCVTDVMLSRRLPFSSARATSAHWHQLCGTIFLQNWKTVTSVDNALN